MLASCKKDDTQPLPSVTFTMYNYSSGSAQTAGSFTLQKLTGGYVSVAVQLEDTYRVPGVTLDAFITTADTSALIYATLGSVNGTSGTGLVNPLRTDGNNAMVLYDSLVLKKGYAVKILNGSNVQAIGTIK